MFILVLKNEKLLFNFCEKGCEIERLLINLLILKKI